MSKPLENATARLQRRKNSAPRGPSFKVPGSMNPHKAYPTGKGHRPRATVAADSRKATS